MGEYQGKLVKAPCRGSHTGARTGDKDGRIRLIGYLKKTSRDLLTCEESTGPNERTGVRLPASGRRTFVGHELRGDCTMIASRTWRSKTNKKPMLKCESRAGCGPHVETRTGQPLGPALACGSTSECHYDSGADCVSTEQKVSA